MTISLSDAGKRFNREWIFRHLNFNFEQGRSYAITGPNGSGKSTLLQVLAGALHINEGSIRWESPVSRGPQNQIISPENVYNHVSFCAPYLELVEEMTLVEFLRFHEGFKPFLAGFKDHAAIISILGLEKSATKQIRFYSSGMKQRVKLAQCIFSETETVLLDEPCTNLDLPGIELYHRLVADYCPGRLVIVSSNDETEYRFCGEKIEISDYK